MYIRENAKCFVMQIGSSWFTIFCEYQYCSSSHGELRKPLGGPGPYHWDGQSAGCHVFGTSKASAVRSQDPDSPDRPGACAWWIWIEVLQVRMFSPILNKLGLINQPMCEQLWRRFCIHHSDIDVRMRVLWKHPSHGWTQWPVQCLRAKTLSAQSNQRVTLSNVSGRQALWHLMHGIEGKTWPKARCQGKK